MDDLFEAIARAPLDEVTGQLDSRTHGTVDINQHPVGDVTARYIGLDGEWHLDHLEELLAREIKLWQPALTVEEMFTALQKHLPAASEHIVQQQEIDTISAYNRGKGGRIWTFAAPHYDMRFSLAELYALAVGLRESMGTEADGLIEGLRWGLYDSAEGEG